MQLDLTNLQQLTQTALSKAVTLREAYEAVEVAKRVAAVAQELPQPKPTEGR